MKKLLLVLALPLMLVGCTDSKSKKEDWTVLQPNQTLNVYYAETDYNFSYRDYSSISYRVSDNYGLMTLRIKTVYLTIKQDFEFKGNTVSYRLTTQS